MSTAETSLEMICTILFLILFTCCVCAYEVFFTWLGRRLVNPIQNSLSRYPSVVFTSQFASINVCHFFTIDLNLSVVRVIPTAIYNARLNGIIQACKSTMSLSHNGIGIVGLLKYNTGLFTAQTSLLKERHSLFRKY